MGALYEPEWKKKRERKEKTQNIARVPKGGNPPVIAKRNRVSEESTAHDILQLKRNHATKSLLKMVS